MGLLLAPHRSSALHTGVPWRRLTGRVRRSHPHPHLASGALARGRAQVNFVTFTCFLLFPLFESLSLSLSLSPAFLALSFSLVYLYLTRPNSVPLSLPVNHALPLSHYLCVCVCVRLSHFLILCVSLSPGVCVCVSLSLTGSVCLSVTRSVSLSHWECVCVAPTTSLSGYVR